MKIKKTKILVLVRFYLPGYKSGGPIRSLSNMIQSLNDDFEFKVITYDRDSHDDTSYKDIIPNTWGTLKSIKIFYASATYLRLKNMIKLLSHTEYDLLYLNTFFHPVFSILPILIAKFSKIIKKPILLAPRGEFSPGALVIKARKKKYYIKFSKVLGLYNSIYWHATNEIEKKEIKSIFPRIPEIFIAPNIPTKPEPDTIHSKQVKIAGSLKIVFLSRISPKKNLDGALNILKNIKGDILFDIIGPIDDEAYWDTCQSIISELDSNIGVKYQGSIKHEQINSTLQSYDLFLFPTHGENFGHVIYESLAAGLPIITSDQTPWHDISDFNAGFEIPNTQVDKYRQIISKFVQMNEEEFNIYRKGASNYASEYFENSNLRIQNRNLFMNIEKASDKSG